MIVDILFDGPPGPTAGRFIEVEDAHEGNSISFGEWVHRKDGYWALRVDLEAEVLKRVPEAP